MKKLFSKKYKLFIYIFGIAYIIYGIIDAQFYIYKIANCEYEIISCSVKEVNRTFKSPGLGINYSYVYEGKTYNGYCIEPLIYKEDFKYNLVNKTIPLLYCKSNFKYQQLLIDPEVFKNRNLTYPDSLAWVKRFIK